MSKAIETEYEELESESHNDADFGGRVASAIVPSETLSSNKTSLRENIGIKSPSFSRTNLSIGQDKNVQSDLIRIRAAEDIQEIFQDISPLSVNKKCAKLVEILCDTNETLHFYSHKIKEQKKNK